MSVVQVHAGVSQCHMTPAEWERFLSLMNNRLSGSRAELSTVSVVTRDPEGHKVPGSLPAGDSAADQNPGQ